MVRVSDASDEPPTIPFWFGEAPGRSDQLSNAVSKFRRAKPGKRTATAEQENELLQAQLHELLDVCRNLSQDRPTPVHPPTLSWCDRCKQTSLVRNGRVRTKQYGLRQRLLCRNCGRDLYVDLKNLCRSPGNTTAAGRAVTKEDRRAGGRLQPGRCRRLRDRMPQRSV